MNVLFKAERLDAIKPQRKGAALQIHQRTRRGLDGGRTRRPGKAGEPGQQMPEIARPDRQRACRVQQHARCLHHQFRAGEGHDVAMGDPSCIAGRWRARAALRTAVWVKQHHAVALIQQGMGAGCAGDAGANDQDVHGNIPELKAASRVFGPDVRAVHANAAICSPGS